MLTPNPKVSYRRTDIHPIPAVAAGKTAVYWASEMNPLPPNNFECKSKSVPVYPISSAGGLFYRDMVGWKHTPYNPKSDNGDPMPYTLDERRYSYPMFVADTVAITSLNGGIACSPWRENRLAFAGTSWSPSVPDLPVSSELENNVISKLNEKLDKKKEVTVNYAMNYFERRQTIDMVTARARQLVKVLRNLRKGRFEKAYYELFGSEKEFRGRRTKDRASKLWLEWTYGWSPLIGDIANAVEDFFKDPPPATLVVKKSGSIGKNTVVNSADSFSIYRWQSLIIPFSVNVHQETKLFYTSTYRVDHKRLVSLSSAGVADPATTAWELVPFSFVADWFVNIGDVIRDYSIADGLTHLHTVRSVKQTVEWQSLGKPVTIGARNNSVALACEASGKVVVSGKTVRFDRTVSLYRPRLGLFINNDPISWRRALSALALTNELVNGLGRSSNKRNR